MITTLFVSYRAIPGFLPGITKEADGRVIVCSTGLTNKSQRHEFPKAVGEMRAKLATELHLAAIPRAVVYVGAHAGEEVRSLVRELMPRDATELAVCPCNFQENQIFAMQHGFQIRPCDCDERGQRTMAKIIQDAIAMAKARR